MKTRTMAGKRQEQLEKAVGLMDKAQDILNDLQSEMQGIADGLEEHFGGTQRYKAVSEIASNLEKARDNVEAAIESADQCDFTSY